MSELKTIYLKDYAPPAYLVEQVELRVELDPTATRVHCRLQLACQSGRRADPAALCISTAVSSNCFEIALDGRPCPATAYRL